MNFKSRAEVKPAGQDRWLVASPRFGRVFVARALDGSGDWQASEANGLTLPVRSVDLDEVMSFVLDE